MRFLWIVSREFCDFKWKNYLKIYGVTLLFLQKLKPKRTFTKRTFEYIKVIPNTTEIKSKLKTHIYTMQLERQWSYWLKWNMEKQSSFVPATRDGESSVISTGWDGSEWVTFLLFRLDQPSAILEPKSTEDQYQTSTPPITRSTHFQLACRTKHLLRKQLPSPWTPPIRPIITE